MQLFKDVTHAEIHRAFRLSNWTSTLTNAQIHLILVILMSVVVGLAVIVTTHYVENVKLLVGLIGGIAFVLFTMKWPEFGILSLVALMSGLISLSWLPLLSIGPISLHISDAILMLLLGLVFLRATTQPGFKLYGSPLTLPLLIFIGAFFLSAANAILIQGLGVNSVIRTVRVLILWILFIPTLQLIRDEGALKRFLAGFMVLTGILLIGVFFPNKIEPFLPIEERVAGTGAQTYSDFTRVYYAGDMILYAMIPVTIASLALIKKGDPLWRIGLLGLLLYWVFKTFFRSYWLTLFVSCILLLAFFSSQERMRLLKRLTPAMLVGVLVVIVLMATQPAHFERISYILTDRVGSLLHDPIKREGSLQWRAIETGYAMNQIRQHPILGLGLANRYRPPMVGETNFYSDWASSYIENGYLYITVMMGLVGLLPFIWLCLAFLFRIVRHNREIRDSGLKVIYLGFGAAFLGMLVCNYVIPALIFGTRLVFFPVAMAISEVILRLESEKRCHP